MTPSFALFAARKCLACLLVRFAGGRRFGIGLLLQIRLKRGQNCLHLFVGELQLAAGDRIPNAARENRRINIDAVAMQSLSDVGADRIARFLLLRCQRRCGRVAGFFAAVVPCPVLAPVVWPDFAAPVDEAPADEL